MDKLGSGCHQLDQRKTTFVKIPFPPTKTLWAIATAPLIMAVLLSFRCLSPLSSRTGHPLGTSAGTGDLVDGHRNIRIGRPGNPSSAETSPFLYSIRGHPYGEFLLPLRHLHRFHYRQPRLGIPSQLQADPAFSSQPDGTGRQLQYTPALGGGLRAGPFVVFLAIFMVNSWDWWLALVGP